jgi:hypothetical protein
MPYPNQYIRGVTTSDTKLEPRQGEAPGGNSLGGSYIGNAHTFRVTSHDAGQTGAIQPPYDYDWTAVTFDGANDYLSNPTNLGLSGSAHVIAAVRIFIDALPVANQTLIGHTTSAIPQSLLAITSTGALRVEAFTNFSNSGFVDETAAGVVPIKQWVTIHLWALQGGVVTPSGDVASIASGSRRVWLSVNGMDQQLPYGFNGATTVAKYKGNVPVDQNAVTPGGWFSAGAGNFTVPTAWTIGALPGGTQKFAGRMSLAWVYFGSVIGAETIVDPGQFTPIRSLGAQLAVPGIRPHIGFGVAQTAVNWNAGTNLGSGTGTWTMNGAVT